jgi:hypothetical protein
MVQDCGSSAMMHGRNCCVIQPSRDPAQPGSATTTEPALGLAAIPATLDAVPLPAATIQAAAVFDDTSPGGLSPGGSILRL